MRFVAFASSVSGNKCFALLLNCCDNMILENGDFVHAWIIFAANHCWCLRLGCTKITKKREENNNHQTASATINLSVFNLFLPLFLAHAQLFASLSFCSAGRRWCRTYTFVWHCDCTQWMWSWSEWNTRANQLWRRRCEIRVRQQWQQKHKHEKDYFMLEQNMKKWQRMNKQDGLTAIDPMSSSGSNAQQHATSN